MLDFIKAVSFLGGPPEISRVGISTVAIPMCNFVCLRGLGTMKNSTNNHMDIFVAVTTSLARKCHSRISVASWRRFENFGSMTQPPSMPSAANAPKIAHIVPQKPVDWPPLFHVDFSVWRL